MNMLPEWQGWATDILDQKGTAPSILGTENSSKAQVQVKDKEGTAQVLRGLSGFGGSAKASVLLSTFCLLSFHNKYIFVGKDGV